MCLTFVEFAKSGRKEHFYSERIKGFVIVKWKNTNVNSELGR